jgi:hypothetical protein
VSHREKPSFEFQDVGRLQRGPRWGAGQTQRTILAAQKIRVEIRIPDSLPAMTVEQTQVRPVVRALWL